MLFEYVMKPLATTTGRSVSILDNYSVVADIYQNRDISKR